MSWYFRPCKQPIYVLLLGSRQEHGLSWRKKINYVFSKMSLLYRDFLLYQSCWSTIFVVLLQKMNFIILDSKNVVFLTKKTNQSLLGLKNLVFLEQKSNHVLLGSKNTV